MKERAKSKTAAALFYSQWKNSLLNSYILFINTILLFDRKFEISRDFLYLCLVTPVEVNTNWIHRSVFIPLKVQDQISCIQFLANNICINQWPKNPFMHCLKEANSPAPASPVLHLHELMLMALKLSAPSRGCLASPDKPLPIHHGGAACCQGT